MLIIPILASLFMKVRSCNYYQSSAYPKCNWLNYAAFLIYLLFTIIVSTAIAAKGILLEADGIKLRFGARKDTIPAS